MSADIVTPVSERFYTVADLARLLKCSERHVRRMADAGKIPGSVKIGRLRRWRASELVAWVQSLGEGQTQTRAKRHPR
ncbi:MAG: helix-turn-helix transcriptional regulator [Planctomycetaceae bacterium]